MAGCQAVIIRPEMPFPFLALPREIRDEIYTHAMVLDIFPPNRVQDSTGNDGVVRFGRVRSDSPEQYKHMKVFGVSRKASTFFREYVRRKQSLSPGLLTVSRQVYHESLQVLYGANEFEMDVFCGLPSIFAKFENFSKFLRRLHIGSFWELRNIGKYLEPLVHLQQLYIEWPTLYSIQDPAHVADVFFDKSHRWIYGVASVYENEVRAASLVFITCDGECPLRCDETKQCSSKICPLTESFQSELKAAILARQSLSFPIMKLPRKIRDKVYCHAMLHRPFKGFDDDITDRLTISSDENNNPMRNELDWREGADKPDGLRGDGFRWSESLTPGLLRVNRQIYQESVQILYGKNNFDLWDHEVAKAWLDRIGNSHVYLRDVNFGFFPDDRTTFYKLLHVDRLSFDFFSHDFDESMSESPEEMAKMFFALASHWIEGVGSFRGGGVAAIDRIHPYAPVSEDEEEQWVGRFRTELKKICG